MAEGKVQFKVGIVDTGGNKVNLRSMEARKKHGDALGAKTSRGTQLGVTSSGHIKRNK